MKRLILTLIVLTGCGSSKDEPQNVNPEAPKVATPTEKPPTTASLIVDANSRPECKVNGQLIYLLTEKEFQACNGTSWNKVDIANTIANTTTTVVKTEAPVSITEGDKEYYVIRMVPKAKRACYEGFHVASTDEMNALPSPVLKSLRMSYEQLIFYFWAAEGTLVSWIYASSQATSATYYAFPETQRPNNFADAGQSIVCIK